MIMCFELGRVRRLPTLRARIVRLVEAGLPFLAPAFCFLLAFQSAVSGPTSYGNLLSKPIAFLADTYTYGAWPDVVFPLGIIAGLWWLTRRQQLAFASDMRLPVMVLILIAVVMPRVLQGVIGADVRLPCLLGFLLVAATDLR